MQLKIRKLQQYSNCLFFPKVGHLGHVCPFFLTVAILAWKREVKK